MVTMSREHIALTTDPRTIFNDFSPKLPQTPPPELEEVKPLATTPEPEPEPFIEPHLSESSFDLPSAELPHISTAPFPESLKVLNDIVLSKLVALNAILTSKDFTQLRSLFASTSYWRDHLGIDPKKLTTLTGVEKIISRLQNTENVSINHFSIEKGKAAIPTFLDPMGTIRIVQVAITFETEVGTGRGMLTLLQDVENGDEWRIYNLFTTLWELKGVKWRDGKNRDFHDTPEGTLEEGMNWAEWREARKDFRTKEPAVLIVGAGHSGLMVAARLGMLGIDALIVDTQLRTGDSWRTRYHDLVLHDVCWMNAMPYLPYPPSWPILASKDKIADFFEYYESALELNVWNTSKITSSVWDSEKNQWNVNIDRTKNGVLEKRTIHPRHIVQATGLNGEPNMPTIPGASTFKGKISHSSNFTMAPGSSYKGKKIVIVGAGTSGHDLALSTYRRGADVTIVQRSAIFVASLAVAHKNVARRWNEDTPTDEGDLAVLSTPMTLLKTLGSQASTLGMATDSHLLSGLRSVGFRLIEGAAQPSLLPLTIHRAGGFYLDIGASSLIASGAIKHKFSKESVARITEHGVVFADGDVVEGVDEIVFATGYGNGRARTRKVFGGDVASGIKPIWGFDQEGEIRGAWRRNVLDDGEESEGQKGFWVAAGSFWISRYYSRGLALQIAMVERGLVGL